MTPTLQNTIVAENTRGAVQGAFQPAGHNFIGAAIPTSGFIDGVSGDQVGTLMQPRNPRLIVIDRNGGLTETHMPVIGGPCVDAGDPHQFEPTDQRGRPRAAGSGDIGVVESDRGFPIFMCDAEPNSTGLPGRLELRGSAWIADNDFGLALNSGPPGQFCLFLTSGYSDPVPIPPAGRARSASGRPTPDSWGRAR